MTIEKIDKDSITVSFSASVGKTGLRKIKTFIESIEADAIANQKLSKKDVKALSDEITKSALEKLKKKRGFEFC